jgi:hypothetical protein
MHPHQVPSTTSFHTLTVLVRIRQGGIVELLRAGPLAVAIDRAPDEPLHEWRAQADGAPGLEAA